MDSKSFWKKYFILWFNKNPEKFWFTQKKLEFFNIRDILNKLE